MKNLKPYLLVTGLLTSTIAFSFLGDYWNRTFYGESQEYHVDNMPFTHAMNGIHDGLLAEDMYQLINNTYSFLAAKGESPWGFFSDTTVTSYSVQIMEDRAEQLHTHALVNPQSGSLVPLQLPITEAIPFTEPTQEGITTQNEPLAEENLLVEHVLDDTTNTEVVTLEADTPVATAKRLYSKALQEGPKRYAFSTATEEYFEDAVFIGDSRTVGICEYSGIENATFLCKTSLSIFDYEKKKITYENKKTSIKEVLSKKNFGKIYVMLGINECRYSTFDEYVEAYKAVIADIRVLQPEALIFIESNLLVTAQKSKEDIAISNEKLQKRNDAIAKLANQQDTFFVDINESSLCEDGALIAEYTWDHIHIKAQYYSLWKDYLLSHAILKS